MSINRRQFLYEMSAGLTCFAASPVKGLVANENKKDKQNRQISFGWTTCLTYQAGERKLGYDYYSQLLENMAAHGMKRLIVMMASHGYFSPGNHGLAWPVRNTKLVPQLDQNALNAHEKTEFFSRVIKKAHKLGIKVYIEIKYLGMIGIHQGYPGVEFLTLKDGRDNHRVPEGASDYERRAIQALHICCDSTPAHDYMRDKIRDVLERYHDLDGLILEHPSYFGNVCYCRGSREKFRLDTGKDIKDTTESEFTNWKNNRIRDTLIDLKQLVKEISPDFEFGFYTGFSPGDGNVAAYQRQRGHNIETLKQVGLDFVLPYCEGRHLDNETRELEKVIDYLSPLKIYVHTTIRKDMPKNYVLPQKDPRYVKKMINWGKDVFTNNDRFIGMTFFNEVKIPAENRKAVYDSI